MVISLLGTEVAHIEGSINKPIQLKNIMSILSKAHDKIVRLTTYNNLGRTETNL
jgi:hypothetical protein